MDSRVVSIHASILCLFLQLVCAVYEINDDIAYKLVWDSGRIGGDVGFHGQSISVSTNVGENYECTVPPLSMNESNVDGALVNSSEMELLEELFRKQPCSVRVEFYWSYELCHKKHVRQFHEELLPDKTNPLFSLLSTHWSR
ncbi:uncharacterized protein DEA37_0009769 [Paragonimus westermani]|uniref:Endoplasmic reticulum lectin 1 n=1 Tax=Paragonimus westermani TaxID=34504 RepID=A0A5J4N7K8_9TREM|nr:uncharacterized protein DEA37_0009769 [Paragonimus westermani]